MGCWGQETLGVLCVGLGGLGLPGLNVAIAQTPPQTSPQTSPQRISKVTSVLSVPSPAKGLALEAQGQRLYERREFQAAAIAWTQAAQTHAAQRQDVAQIRSLSLASLAYQQQGDWGAAQEAIATALSLLALQPQSEALSNVQTQAGLINGTLHFTRGEWAQARQAWGQVVQQAQSSTNPTPTDPTPLVLGQLNLALVDDAQDKTLVGLARLEDLKKLLQKQPETPQTQVLQAALFKTEGDLLSHLGRWTEAQARWEAALAIAQSPNLQTPNLQTPNLQTLTGSLWLSLGQAARQQNNLSQAQHAYGQASQNADPTLQILTQLAQLELALQPGANAAALPHWPQLQASLAKQPAQPLTLWSHLRLIELLQQANIQEPLTTLAHRAVQQAYALGDSQAIAQSLRSLGQVYALQGQPERAESLYQEAQMLIQPDLSSPQSGSLGVVELRSPLSPWSTAILPSSP